MSDSKRLIVVCGLPGTGKTTVANEIASRLDGTVIRTDVVRKELYPDPEYTAAETRATYDELFSRAGATLERDGTAVLDGTFRRAELRERARAVAEERRAAFDLVRVECDEDVVRDRIAEREGDASDADYSVYELLEAEFEPPTLRHVTVDNSGSVGDTRRQLVDIL